MRILAISSGEKSAEALCSLIRDAGEINVTSCISAATARRNILDEAWDLAIINYPLSDESGLELGAMITEETDIAVIMLVKEDLIASVGYDAEEYGIICVSKPVIRPIFKQAIRLAYNLRKRLEKSKNEIKRLEMKLDEQKLVDRAKCALISSLSMSEEEAHRYILKLAMDRRISSRDSAVYILKDLKGK